MPFAANTFDFVVCVAAFKNFTEPVTAIREMYRVLMPGGIALINDLRGDASQADVDAMVEGMQINAMNKFMTRLTFRHMLLKNAYTAAQIQQMASQTEFRQARIEQDMVSMNVWLEKKQVG